MPHEARALLTAFLRAEYGCDDHEPRLLHIGESAPSAQARCWITAWNPLGHPRAMDRNEASQQRFQARIAASGWISDPGFARAPASDADSRWFEPCRVIRDAPADFIDTLARHYRQLAVVTLAVGAPARLRCYRRFWIARFGVADMDDANIDWVA